MRQIVLILSVLVLLLCVKCSRDSKDVASDTATKELARQAEQESINKEIVREVYEHTVYYRDSRTGLCYAATKNHTYMYDTYTQTCVPCDSLSNVRVYVIEPKVPVQKYDTILVPHKETGMELPVKDTCGKVLPNTDGTCEAAAASVML
jgi:hypothetical protein